MFELVNDDGERTSTPIASFIVMNRTSSIAEAITLRRLAETSPAWSLLRASHAPAIVSTLATLFHGDNRTLAGSELILAVEAILIDLREQADMDLPKTATAYVSDWVKSGYLVRRSPQGSREEFYELSADAHLALDYLQQMAHPQRAVTKSRLSSLFMNLRELASETDPDEDAAVRRLEAQRDQIQARIDRIRDGNIHIISEVEAIERTREILSLVRDLPADFARVRSDIEEVDRLLRESILQEETSAAEVLDNVFRGVDLIAESDAGRAFNGFYEMFLDNEYTQSFKAALDAVSSRDFVNKLDRDERMQLRDLLDYLDDSSGQVDNSRTSLSRSMRRFVQSREAESQQALTAAINEAQKKAVEVAKRGVNARTATGFELELTTRQLQSISTWKLHDPMDYHIDRHMEVHETGKVDLEAMRARIRESEIDWDELRGAVNSVVEERGVASIQDVLEAHPATQGLASVVGLIKLAHRHGDRGDGSQLLRWESKSGKKLQARYDLYNFTQEI